MLKIGLTGGIASGKSAVANLFAEFGAAVIDTDSIAREVVAPGEPGLQEIVDNFGNDVLLEDGSLNRRKLRDLVFNDPDKKALLESLLHPRIRKRTLQMLSATDRDRYPYAIVVVPLLVETGFGTLVDRVLVVDTTPELQQQRLMQRDSMDSASAVRIINQQAERSRRLSAADDVIENSGSFAELRAAAAELHAHYLELATKQPAAKP